MRHHAFLCTALLACSSAKGPDEGSPTGDFALSFNGDTSCASGSARGDLLVGGFTIEAWVQADDNVDYGAAPIAAWPGGFMLWASADDHGYFTDDGGAGAGASSVNGWMDGSPHHVAGTWDGDSVALFIDGALQGIGSGDGIATAPGGNITIGCAPAMGYAHDGLIDELRVSSVVRYSEDFSPPSSIFSPDEATLHLWHFDEGTGTSAVDAVGGSTLQLTDVLWSSMAWAEDTGS